MSTHSSETPTTQSLGHDQPVDGSSVLRQHYLRRQFLQNNRRVDAVNTSVSLSSRYSFVVQVVLLVAG